MVDECNYNTRVCTPAGYRLVLCAPALLSVENLLSFAQDTHTPTQSQSRSRSSTNIDCAYKCKWKVLLVLVNHIFLFVNIFFCHFKRARLPLFFFFRIEKPFLHTNTPIAYKNTHNYTNAI